LRTVACSVNPAADASVPDLARCPDPAVAELNAGFIRPDADLVLIFISDEDDCSFHDVRTYRKPASASAAEQAAHLCTPTECYAYYNAGKRIAGHTLDEWSDPLLASGGGYFKCFNAARRADPPLPDATSGYLDALIALKGGEVARVRAAGIISGKTDPGSPLGFLPRACYQAGDPSSACGCLSTSGEPFFCELTRLIGQQGLDAGGQRSPAAHTCPSGSTDPVCYMCGEFNPPLGGCEALPGSRYHAFLNDLANRRIAASVRPDILVDSICKSRYEDTLLNIVNNVILSNCFDLGQIPTTADDIQVSLNGKVLERQEPGSTLRGWSWVPGTSQVCLQGGLRKALEDKFEIFFLTGGS
jgi:hypothetical protein